MLRKKDDKAPYEVAHVTLEDWRIQSVTKPMELSGSESLREKTLESGL